MIKVELKDYQKEAVTLAINVPFHLIACQVGRGKSLIATFYTRYLINKNLADKVILAGTKTSVNSFHKAFGVRAGIKIPQYDKVDEVLDFFTNDEKVCIIKHSIIEKLGYDQNCLDFIYNAMSNNYKRIAIVIDECHKLSNDKSKLHFAFTNLRFAFERISLQTATPYSTSIIQLYGLVSLIQPKLWKNQKAFRDKYIEEKVIIDYKTKRIKRKEEVAYHNLDQLREEIKPFTYFYYPPLDLNFIEHRTRLKSYDKYDDICRGVLTEDMLKDGE